MKRLGREIQSRRIGNGWTRMALANELGCSAKTVARWERGETDPQAHHVRGLIRVLGVTSEELAPLIRGDEIQTEYACYDFMEASELVSGVEELANRLNGLPHPPLPKIPDNGNDLGAPEKWVRIYKRSPETVAVLLKDQSTVAGFWHCVRVDASTYAAIRQGKNINASITEDDVRILAIPGSYDIYFVDLSIDPVHRNPRTRGLLLRSFLDFVREHAQEATFFRRIAAHAAFHESQDICRDLGFLEVCRHLTHRVRTISGELEPTPVFELVLDPRKKAHFFDLDAEIRRLYLAAQANNLLGL